MVTLCLISADTALRAAIAEQVSIAALGGLQESAAPPAALPDDTAAVMIDAPLAEKSAALFRAENASAKIPRAYILGEASWPAEIAAEFFPKPLRLGHLLARLQFHLHMAAHAPGAPLRFGRWRLEPQNRQLVIESDGAIQRLTEKETELLEYLARKNTAVSREELLAAIWGYDRGIDTHTLETHIYRLRRKLAADGAGAECIAAEGGFYRIVW